MKTHHTCSTELLSELVLCLSILMDDDKQPLQIISDSDLMICFVEILTKDYEPTWGYKLKVYLITVLGKIAASSIVNRDELLKSFFIYDHILSQLESLQIHLPEMINYCKERKQYGIDPTSENFDASILPIPLQHARDKVHYLQLLSWTVLHIYTTFPPPNNHLKEDDHLLDYLLLYYQSIDEVDVLINITCCLLCITPSTPKNVLNKNNKRQLLFHRINDILINKVFLMDSEFFLQNDQIIYLFYKIFSLIGLFATLHIEDAEIIAEIIDFHSIVNDVIRQYPDPSLQGWIVRLFHNGLSRSPLLKERMIKYRLHAYLIELVFTTPHAPVYYDVLRTLVLLLDPNDDRETILAVKQIHAFNRNERVIQLVCLVIQHLQKLGYAKEAAYCLNTMLCMETKRIKVFG